MELKEGMYVRTKYGIFKIRKITKDLAYRKHEKRVLELDRNIPEYDYRFSFYKVESIFKGAKFKDNIIDLIEVGDYVNGSKVEQIDFGLNDDRVQVVTTECYVGQENFEYDVISANEIKSIVTKEQFEAMKYEIK